MWTTKLGVYDNLVEDLNQNGGVKYTMADFLEYSHKLFKEKYNKAVDIKHH